MDTYVQMDQLLDRLRRNTTVSFGFHGTALNRSQRMPQYIYPAHEHGVCRWHGTSDEDLAYYEGLHWNENYGDAYCHPLIMSLRWSCDWASKAYCQDRHSSVDIVPALCVVSPEGPIARDMNFAGDVAKLTAARLRVHKVIFLDKYCSKGGWYNGWDAGLSLATDKKLKPWLDNLWRMSVEADRSLPVH